jgi:hypothetical protein
MKRLIFFISEPFTKACYDKFGIETLEKNGFKVEVWDLDRVVNKNFGNEYAPPDPLNWPGLVTFRGKEALDKIKQLDCESFVILFIGYFYQSYGIYRALSESGADYANFMANTIPFPFENKREYLRYYLNNLRRITLKKVFSKTLILNFAFRRFNSLWPKVKPPRLVLAGGEKCVTEFYPNITAESEILKVHNLDYDIYLREREIPYRPTNTAVFLDSGFAYHPDYKYRGVKQSVTPEEYFKALNNFFEMIEKNLDLKVVIAAHPRIDYSQHPETFKGRKCIRGETMRLVKESSLVVVSYTTALSFANIFNRPVIFVTTKEIEASADGPRILETAKWFGKKPIFIDCPNPVIDWEKEQKVSAEDYKKYRENYIKMNGSEEMPFWQIVANRLKRL